MHQIGWKIQDTIFWVKLNMHIRLYSEDSVNTYNLITKSASPPTEGSQSVVSWNWTELEDYCQTPTMLPGGVRQLSPIPTEHRLYWLMSCALI